MDIIIGVFQALLALLGWIDEQEAIRAQCQQYLEAGAIPYPPPADMRRTLEECEHYFDEYRQ